MAQSAYPSLNVRVGVPAEIFTALLAAASRADAVLSVPTIHAMTPAECEAWTAMQEVLQRIHTDFLSRPSTEDETTDMADSTHPAPPSGYEAAPLTDLQ